MKIYNSIESFHPVKNANITIGTFDGVHAGHRKIIDRLNDLKAQNNGEIIVLTFFPHPRMVLYPDSHGLMLLNTMKEKALLLEKAGVDHLIIQPFSHEFSRLNGTDFVRNILVNQLHVKQLVIGYDHHFGRNREGSISQLFELSATYNFSVEQVEEAVVNDVAVSSTKIRNALLDGNIYLANNLLGYKYQLTGKVVKGNQIGKKLGYPTANIEMDEDYKLIPADGIYAVRVYISNQNNKLFYKGALSIGTRPTFGEGLRTVEVFILDFNSDIYGQKLTLEFVERLRHELKFETVDELVLQMKQDVELVKRLIEI